MLKPMSERLFRSPFDEGAGGPGTEGEGKTPITHMTVYLGNRPGMDEEYARFIAYCARVYSLGGQDCVYGGADRGGMWAYAQVARNLGREVIGITAKLFQERAWKALGENLHTTETLALRRAGLARGAVVGQPARRNAIVNLPGGWGTLDEAVEAIRWAGMGYHNKPISFLAPDDYWEGFREYLEHLKDKGEIDAASWQNIRFLSGPSAPQEDLVQIRQREASGRPWIDTIDKIDLSQTSPDEAVKSKPEAPLIIGDHSLLSLQKICTAMTFNQRGANDHAEPFGRPVIVLDPDGVFERTAGKWIQRAAGGGLINTTDAQWVHYARDEDHLMKLAASVRPPAFDPEEKQKNLHGLDWDGIVAEYSKSSPAPVRVSNRQPV